MIEMKVEGLEMIQENLDMMVVAVRDRILKKALREAGKPILAFAKASCPADTGTLRDSITMKESSKGTKGIAASIIIGPKTGIRVPAMVVRRGKNTGLIRVLIPTYYAHLVEFGHRVVVNGKVIGSVTPRSFMRAAWDEYGGDAALYTIVDELVKGVEEELAKTYRYK